MVYTNSLRFTFPTSLPPPPPLFFFFFFGGGGGVHFNEEKVKEREKRNGASFWNGPVPALFRSLSLTISCVISLSFWRSHLVCDISCVISSSFWRSHLVCDISCVISSSFWRSQLVCDISCVIYYATNRSRRNQMLLSVVWEAKVHTQCVEWPWTHPGRWR